MQQYSESLSFTFIPAQKKIKGQDLTNLLLPANKIALLTQEEEKLLLWVEIPWHENKFKNC